MGKTKLKMAKRLELDLHKRSYMNDQSEYETMLDIVVHQRNTSENCNGTTLGRTTHLTKYGRAISMAVLIFQLQLLFLRNISSDSLPHTRSFCLGAASPQLSIPACSSFLPQLPGSSPSPSALLHSVAKLAESLPVPCSWCVSRAYRWSMPSPSIFAPPKPPHSGLISVPAQTHHFYRFPNTLAPHPFVCFSRSSSQPIPITLRISTKLLAVVSKTLPG